MSPLVWALLLIALSGRCIHGQNSTNRIIGGSSLDIKEAPYQANIIVDGSPCCSGAIIGSKRILTAAGCVYGCPTSSVRVRVGSSSREGGGTLARICGINTHPQYSSYRYDNNLAILELCEPLTFTDSIKAINVTDKVPDDSSLAQVTGWGSTSWWGSWWDRTFGSLPDQLQAATVSFYNREQCAYDLSDWFWVSDYGVSDLTLCTYSYDKAACSYDTGAPLVKNKQLVGILSYGGCTKYPDVYANLIRFRSWLGEVTAATESTTTKSTNITETTASTPSNSTTTKSTSNSTTTESTTTAGTSSNSTTTESTTNSTTTESTTTAGTSSNSTTTESTTNSTTTESTTNRTTTESTTTAGTSSNSTTTESKTNSTTTESTTTAGTSSNSTATTNTLSNNTAPGNNRGSPEFRPNGSKSAWPAAPSKRVSPAAPGGSNHA